MRKVLIASHGRLASGIKSSIGILLGMQDEVQAVDAYVDDSDYTGLIQDFIDSVGPEDEGVIFTDIYGGSVFQKVVLLRPEDKGIMHVTGTNLSTVIEVLLAPGPLTQEELDSIVSESRQFLVRVEPAQADGEEDEPEGDFFD